MESISGYEIIYYVDYTERSDCAIGLKFKTREDLRIAIKGQCKANYHTRLLPEGQGTQPYQKGWLIPKANRDQAQSILEPQKILTAPRASEPKGSTRASILRPKTFVKAHTFWRREEKKKGNVKIKKWSEVYPAEKAPYKAEEEAQLKTFGIFRPSVALGKKFINDGWAFLENKKGGVCYLVWGAEDGEVGLAALLATLGKFTKEEEDRTFWVNDKPHTGVGFRFVDSAGRWSSIMVPNGRARGFRGVLEGVMKKEGKIQKARLESNSEDDDEEPVDSSEKSDSSSEDQEEAKVLECIMCSTEHYEGERDYGRCYICSDDDNDIFCDVHLTKCEECSVTGCGGCGSVDSCMMCSIHYCRDCMSADGGDGGCKECRRLYYCDDCLKDGLCEDCYNGSSESEE